MDAGAAQTLHGSLERAGRPGGGLEEDGGHDLVLQAVVATTTVHHQLLHLMGDSHQQLDTVRCQLFH